MDDIMDVRNLMDEKYDLRLTFIDQAEGFGRGETLFDCGVLEILRDSLNEVISKRINETKPDPFERRKQVELAEMASRSRESMDS